MRLVAIRIAMMPGVSTCTRALGLSRGPGALCLVRPQHLLCASTLMVHAVQQVMLSSPDDFEGAELQHEVRGEAAPVVATMKRGDVTVYRSHQAHRVTPLTAGRRRVIAIELWHDLPGSSSLFELHSGTGEPSAARGRPHRRYGQCPV